MNVELAVDNGLVVTPGEAARLSIGIAGGRVVALAEDAASLEAETRVDAAGLVVLPGVVEPHCHFWDPGPIEREDWGTGTRSAAAGGVTTVIEMPLSDPPTVDGPAFDVKLERARRLAHVDFALWGGIVPASMDDLPGRVSELRTRGAVGFKAFMCWSAREYPPIDDGVLLAAMRELAPRGMLLGLHAENDAIILEHEASLRAAGRTSPQDYVHSRPVIAEVEAIERAALLAEETGARIYIVHLSSARGAAAVLRARRRGVDIHVETAPQYLVLDRTALDRLGPYAKCSPPLRSRENVEELWGYVLDGTIDSIGSDHAPFTRAEKEPGLDDIWLAPNGIPGIQTMLPLLFSEGARRGLPLERLADLLAGAPARLFGLAAKGRIAVGADADLALVDPTAERTLRDDELEYKNAWSPYTGLKVRGSVVRTILRGQTVFADDRVLSEPGFGRQVRPG